MTGNLIIANSAVHAGAAVAITAESWGAGAFAVPHLVVSASGINWAIYEAGNQIEKGYDWLVDKTYDAFFK